MVLRELLGRARRISALVVSKIYAKAAFCLASPGENGGQNRIAPSADFGARARHASLDYYWRELSYPLTLPPPSPTCPLVGWLFGR